MRFHNALHITTRRFVFDFYPTMHDNVMENKIEDIVRGVLKATIYMSAKAVVIADRVGEINDLIINGENGLLIDKPTDWLKHLNDLKTDKLKFLEISNAGYEVVKSKYSKVVIREKLLSVIQ